MARHPGHLGPDRGCARDRRGRLRRLQSHAIARHTFLPEPDVVQRRLLHRESRRGRGICRLGVARGTAGDRRDRDGASLALAAAGGREDERQERRGRDSQTMKTRLSFWQIWNMSFGFLGIQFGWGLQQANMSALYEKLGAKAEDIPILWLAAPLTGLLVQPL